MIGLFVNKAGVCVSVCSDVSIAHLKTERLPYLRDRRLTININAKNRQPK